MKKTLLRILAASVLGTAPAFSIELDPKGSKDLNAVVASHVSAQLQSLLGSSEEGIDAIVSKLDDSATRYQTKISLKAMLQDLSKLEPGNARNLKIEPTRAFYPAGEPHDGRTVCFFKIALSGGDVKSGIVELNLSKPRIKKDGKIDCALTVLSVGLSTRGLVDN